MAGTTVKVTSLGLDNLGDLVQLTAEDMRDVGDLLVRRIRTRTEAGQDVNGASFAPYSPGYEAQKRGALGHARVDLTVSGRMLNDMQVTSTTKDSATISFISQGGGASGGTFIQRSRSLGAADKAIYNDPTRHFFAASDEDERVIADAVKALIEARFSQG
jgi:hypothetical protein